MKKAFKKLKRRSALLLEVIIACVILVMVILPLVEPHLLVFRGQKEFVHEVKLDHAVNILYVDILQQLYENRIPFQSIAEGTKFNIDSSTWKTLGVDPPPPYKGTYHFKETKHKPKDGGPVVLYLYQLKMQFSLLGKEGDKSKGSKPLEYNFDITLLRKLPVGKETPQGEVKIE